MGDPKRYWKEAIGATDATGALPAAASGAAAAGLAPVEQILSNLPLGSIAFGNEVAKLLWPDPSPTDLKCLATIVERRIQLPSGPARDATLRSVQLRQRAQRLALPGLRPGFDAGLAQARAKEWGRIAILTRELRKELADLLAANDGPALLAARDLLPEPADLEAEAAIAGEVTALLETAHGLRTATDATALGLPEAVDLLSAIQGRRTRPHDDVFLDVLAGCLLARRALSGGGRDELQLQQRVLARLATRLERAIISALDGHRRDPEQNAVLATWRRRLADTRSLIDEALTRPGGGSIDPPPKPAPAATPGRSVRPSDTADEAIVDHLRHVRKKVERVDPLPAPPETPARRGRFLGWRRWFSRQ